MEHGELYAALAALSEDEYVLHGSPEKCATVWPRRPYFPGGFDELRECAVYATPVVEVALFYAVIHETRDRWGWTFDMLDTAFRIVGPDGLRGGRGYIHVLPRESFVDVPGGLMCRSARPIAPVQVFEADPTILMYLQQEHILQFEDSVRSVH